MNGYQVNTTTPIETKSVSGYKVIEINVSNTPNSLYAVVTPIKIKE
ncbi:hypothetical protein ACOI1C_06110 [Bacillus sp. DJP31]